MTAMIITKKLRSVVLRGASTAFATLLFTTPGVAFESPEHFSVSNDALAIAWAFAARHKIDWGDKGERRLAAEAIIETFQKGCDEKIPGQETYGSLVVLADMTASPLRELRLRSNGGPWPEGCKDFDPQAISAFGRRSTQWAAAHTNADHFQNAAMQNVAWWHRTAITLAANEHNLFAALFINAFADHFLQDFFAPGHIATPREEYHDVPSLATHDHYNSIGAKFIINQRRWPQLETLVVKASPSHAKDLVKLRMQVNELKQQRIIDLFGDNLLDKAKYQRLFVTLVTARSIADILESYITGDTVDSFDIFFWLSRGRSKEGDFHGYRACISFGHYAETLELHPTTTSKPLEPPECYESRATAAPIVPQPDADQVTTAEGFWARLLEWQRLYKEWDWEHGMTMPWVFGASVDYQDFVGRRSEGRTVVTAETLLGGLPPSGNFDRDDNEKPVGPLRYGLGLTAGYTFVNGDNHTGHGPTLRLILPITDLNLQLSLAGGARHYVSSDRAAWRPNYVFMFESGFSLLTARLSVGWDSEFSTPKHLRDGVTLGAGLGIAVPWSRVSRGLGELAGGPQP